MHPSDPNLIPLFVKYPQEKQLNASKYKDYQEEITYYQVPMFQSSKDCPIIYHRLSSLYAHF